MFSRFANVHKIVRFDLKLDHAAQDGLILSDEAKGLKIIVTLILAKLRKRKQSKHIKNNFPVSCCVAMKPFQWLGSDYMMPLIRHPLISRASNIFCVSAAVISTSSP